MTSTDKLTSVQFPENKRYIPNRARQGGMGVAFFCVDQTNHQSVVLKALRIEKADDSAHRVRFLQEIVDWVYLGQHPYIVQAYRVEQLGNPPHPYLVLEQITGRNEGDEVSIAGLLKRRKGHPLSFRMAVKIVWQVGQAMNFATSKISGLVHRDIKPANILVGADGDARLTDFGLAYSFEAFRDDPDKYKEKIKRLDLKEFRPAGSPPYIAPEQWQPGNLADQRVDIYALGITLFEMVTATRCVRGKELKQIEESHCTGDLNPIPEQVPQQLTDILYKCLALKPVDRYQSWEELIEDLDQCYQSLSGESLQMQLTDLQDQREDLLKTYFSIADAYFNLGLLNEAERYASEIRIKVQEADDIELLVDLDQLRGLIYATQDEHDAAINVFTEALTTAHKSGLKSKEIELMSILGDQFIRADFIKKGVQTLMQARDLAADGDYEGLEVMTLGNLANAYAQQDDFESAVEIYMQQLALPIIEHDPVIQSQVMTNLGFALLERRNSEGAIERFNHACELAQACGDISGQSHAMRGLCEAYIGMNDAPKVKQTLTNYQKFSAKWRDKSALQWISKQLEKVGPA